MAYSKTTLAQILAVLPKHEFEELSRQHPSEVKPRIFTRWAHFVTMLTAQIIGLDSLRSIVDYFALHAKKLYHLGIGRFSRSTLSRANSRESDVPIFQEVFYKLLSHCQAHAPRGRKFNLGKDCKIYLIDATLIRLSLLIYSWAKYRSTKGSVKAHIGIDIDGYLPSFVNFDKANVHEINHIKKQIFPRYSYLVFDRGYINYKLFEQFTRDDIYFITRLKSNSVFEVISKRRGCKSKHVVEDSTIKFNGIETVFRYVRIIDYENGNKEYEFVTNAHHIKAETVAALYKERWQIELFFKWIKQHLKVKSFVGTTESAVQIQLWIALCAYLMVSFLKFCHQVVLSLWDILRKLRFILFENRDLTELFIPPKPKIPRKIKRLSKA